MNSHNLFTTIYIISAIILSILIPPLWILLLVGVLFFAAKKREGDIEDANQQIKVNKGDDYNKEARGNQKTGIWLLVILTIVISLGVVDIVGSFTNTLPH